MSWGLYNFGKCIFMLSDLSYLGESVPLPSFFCHSIGFLSGRYEEVDDYE